MRRAVLDNRDVGAGATTVQRQNPFEACRLSQQRRPQRARGRTTEQCADRLPGNLACGDHSAVGLHDVERRRRADLVAQPRFDLADVPGHARLYERIDQRRHRALVLAVFGQHL